MGGGGMGPDGGNWAGICLSLAFSRIVMFDSILQLLLGDTEIQWTGFGGFKGALLSYTECKITLSLLLSSTSHHIHPPHPSCILFAYFIQWCLFFSYLKTNHSLSWTTHTLM